MPSMIEKLMAYPICLAACTYTIVLCAGYIGIIPIIMINHHKRLSHHDSFL